MSFIKNFKVSFLIKKGRVNYYLSTHISAKVLGIPVKLQRFDKISNPFKSNLL